MALYEIAQRGTVTTSGNANHDIASSSTGVRPRVMEWGLFLGAATASTYSIARTTALGTRTTPTVMIGNDLNEPALTGIVLVDSAIAFSVQPTLVATRLRRIGLPATIGTGVVWTFPRGLVMNTGGSYVCQNEATNSAALDFYLSVDV